LFQRFMITGVKPGYAFCPPKRGFVMIFSAREYFPAVVMLNFT